MVRRNRIRIRIRMLSIRIIFTVYKMSKQKRLFDPKFQEIERNNVSFNLFSWETWILHVSIFNGLIHCSINFAQNFIKHYYDCAVYEINAHFLLTSLDDLWKENWFQNVLTCKNMENAFLWIASTVLSLPLCSPT